MEKLSTIFWLLTMLMNSHSDWAIFSRDSSVFHEESPYTVSFIWSAEVGDKKMLAKNCMVCVFRWQETIKVIKAHTDTRTHKQRIVIYKTLNTTSEGLTGVYGGLESQVALLNVEGKHVDFHRAVADHHHVGPKEDGSAWVKIEIRTGKSLILPCPVWEQKLMFSTEFYMFSV